MGHLEGVYCPNRGNFIELVQLMNKSDPIVGKHYLKEVNDNRW